MALPRVRFITTNKIRLVRTRLVLVMLVAALAMVGFGCEKIFYGNLAVSGARVTPWLNGATSAVSFTFDLKKTQRISFDFAE